MLETVWVSVARNVANVPICQARSDHKVIAVAQTQ